MKRPMTIFSIVVALALVGASVATGLPVNPYPTAPLCVTHDDRAWHGLWNADLGCHYDHTHGDDPHALDAAFGTDLWAIMGGEISYPWQTFNSAGVENYLKHQGYYWIVRDGLTCPTAPTAGCIKSFRALVHQMADGHDTPVRYHSFVLEAEVCPNDDLNNCGFVRIGGWQDTGDLEVNGVVVIDEPNSYNRVKQHSSTGGGAVWYPSSQIYEQGRQGFARVSLTIYDEWDYTSPTNPSQFTDYICYPAPRCRNNGTSLFPHLLVVDAPNEYQELVDPDGNGIADFAGYLNRYGEPVSGCSGVSVDCVPFLLSNIRVDVNYSMDATAGARDYDVYFCNGVWCAANSPGARPSGWVQPHH